MKPLYAVTTVLHHPKPPNTHKRQIVRIIQVVMALLNPLLSCVCTHACIILSYSQQYYSSCKPCNHNLCPLIENSAKSMFNRKPGNKNLPTIITIMTVTNPLLIHEMQCCMQNYVLIWNITSCKLSVTALLLINVGLL